MLKNTFLHLSGIGEQTEQKIWRHGVHTWLDFMNSRGPTGLGPLRTGQVRSGVVESIQRYEQANWTYFNERLPASQKWRVFGDFSDRTLYVDIETDGGVGPECITMIGTYDGNESRIFVKDADLDQAIELIESYPVVATFNGACFDMPMICSRFRNHLFNHVHIDLMYPLRRLGQTGGLKRIEKALGIRRDAATEGLDGWDAVRLWNEHQAGHPGALELLVKYNEEDIRNLQPLMQWVYREMSQRHTPGGVQALAEKETSQTS